MWWLSMMVALAAKPAWVEQEAFSSEPGTLRAAADEVTSDASVVVLLDGVSVSVDDLGIATKESRLIWHLRDASAIEGWSTSEVVWSPEWEERPVLEARILRPDGTVVRLDPEAIQEAGSSQTDPSTLDDRRRLRAPLPGITVGVIVEERTIRRDTRPYLGVPGVVMLPLAPGYEGTQHLERRVEGPKAHFEPTVLQAPGVELKTKRLGPRTRSIVHIETPETWERTDFLPPDQSLLPVLRVDFGGTWNDVASTWMDASRGAFDPQGLEPLIASLKELPDDDARIERAYRIAQDIRYTGVQFGVHSVVPHAPRDVLRLGYGDCKDKAALLVTLLQAVDIVALPALLRAGPGWDVSPAGVTPDRLDHAIVHLPASGRWLDPTDEARLPDELPYTDKGRWALVVGPDGGTMVKTPAEQASDNVLREQRILTVSPGEPTRFRERTVATGWKRDDLKSWLGKNPRKTVESWAEVFEATYQSHTVSPPGTPFSMEVELTNPSFAALGAGDLAVGLEIESLLDGLPAFLTKDPLPASRTAPLQWSPFLHERTTRIELPRGFTLVVDDAFAFDEHIGHARIRQQVTVADDGAILVQQSLNGGEGRLTVDEATRLRERLVAWNASPPMLEFMHPARQAFDAGDAPKAMELALAAIEAHPDEAMGHLMAGFILAEVGLRDAALPYLERSTELAPTLDATWRTLADTRYADPVGRFGAQPLDLLGARAAYAKLVEVAPHDTDAFGNLAVAREVGIEGVAGGRGADPEGALAALAVLHELGDWKAFRVNEGRLLLSLGRCEALKPLLDVLEDQPSFLVAYRSCLEGSKAGLLEASRLQRGVEERVEVLKGAATLLVDSQPVISGELLLAVTELDASLTVERVGKARIAGVQGIESLRDEPESALVFAYAAGAEGPAAFLSRVVPEGQDSEAMRKVARMEPTRTTQLPFDLVLDIMVQSCTRSAEGSAAHGWKIAIVCPHATDVAFAVDTPDGPRLRAVNLDLQELGEEAMARLDRGDRKGARRWLGWAAEMRVPDLPFHEHYVDTSDEAILRRQAAYLTAKSPRSQKLLKEAYDQETDPAVRLWIAKRLALIGLESGRPPLFLDAFLESVRPADRVGFEAVALAWTGDGPGARELATGSSLKPVVDLHTYLLEGDFDGAALPTSSGRGRPVLVLAMLGDPTRRDQGIELAKTLLVSNKVEEEEQLLLFCIALGQAMNGDVIGAGSTRRRAAEAAGSTWAMADHGAMVQEWRLVEGWMLRSLGHDELAAKAFESAKPAPAKSFALPVSYAPFFP